MKWIVAVVLAACAGPKAPAEKAGRAARIEIGQLEAYALEDGHLVVPNDGKLLGQGVRETGDLLAAAGLPRDQIHLDIQALAVKAGDRVILFDTGAGGELGADAGRLQQSLALAGIAPIAVTDIFISHAHSDHVGGLVTKTGALAFPAATIRMSAPEWTALQADTDDNGKRLVTAIASKVTPFEPGAQVLPIVKAVATHGHTAGHSAYEIGADDSLFFLGDIAHHVVISVQRPAWPMGVDADHAAADAIRQQTIAQLAAEHTRVFAPHFPFPGVGQITGDGVWKPN